MSTVEENLSDIRTREKDDILFESRGCVILEELEPIKRKDGYNNRCYRYLCNCGRIATSTVSNFRAIKKPCPKCYLPSIEDVKQLFHDVDCIPLFDRFDDKEQDLPFQCVCGEKDVLKYVDIKRQKMCKKCICYRLYQRYLETVDLFEKNDCKLVSRWWVTVMDTIDYICKCNRPAKTTVNRFKAGHFCKKCADDEKSYTSENIKRFLEQLGCKLVGEYDRKNKNYIPYICKCEKQFDDNNKQLTVKLDQLTRKGSMWIGCNTCSKDRERYDYNTVFDTFEERGCTLLSKTYKNRCEYLDYICCCGCVGKIQYRDILSGGLCKRCSSERAALTSISRYGVDNPAKSEIIKKKIRENTFKKYGVEHIMKDPKYVKMAQETNMKRYGEKYAFCMQETYEKIKETWQSRLGVDYPMQNPIYMNRLLIKAKVTCQERYGVDHHTKDPVIFDKIINNYRKKEFVFPSGNTIYLQGFEPFAVQNLLDIGFKEEDIITDCKKMPEIFYKGEDGKKHRYFPDIFLEKEKLFIEVKSSWTYNLEKRKNKLKFKGVVDSGYYIELQMYDKHGSIKKSKIYS